MTSFISQKMVSCESAANIAQGAVEKANELEKLISNLNRIAKKGGGSGFHSTPALASSKAQTKYNRLTKESLHDILSFINADDEFCSVTPFIPIGFVFELT